MASASVMSPSIARIAKEEANRMPWADLRRMVEAIGDLKFDLKTPEGVEVTKQQWAAILTLVGAANGLLVLRDGYGESLTFTPIPNGLLDND